MPCLSMLAQKLEFTERAGQAHPSGRTNGGLKVSPIVADGASDGGGSRGRRTAAATGGPGSAADRRGGARHRSKSLEGGGRATAGQAIEQVPLV